MADVYETSRAMDKLEAILSEIALFPFFTPPSSFANAQFLCVLLFLNSLFAFGPTWTRQNLSQTRYGCAHLSTATQGRQHHPLL